LNNGSEETEVIELKDVDVAAFKLVISHLHYQDFTYVELDVSSNSYIHTF